MDKARITEIVDSILASKKYRAIQVPRETIEDLIQNALTRYSKQEAAIKSVREKLHNITAPYLETLDYDAALHQLKNIDLSLNNMILNEFCLETLSSHHSTRERLPYMQEFFSFLFSRTLPSATILDLACGLIPFALACVSTPKSVQYLAFDIHKKRVNLLNSFFDLAYINGKAVWQDILVRPPKYQADAAFFFKEAHRMEKREKGATRRIFTALNVPLIFLSLPSRSMNRQHDLHDRMNKLAEGICSGIGRITHIEDFPAEIVYEIKKYK
jgi:16S rRNA (guanine(1405)-N(7))-methyltransferase